MRDQKLLPFITGYRRGNKAALAALVAGVLIAGIAPAQNEELEEVVVMGIRENLKNAQQIKYEADTVVDSITAEDLGSFPDKSVAEALQRVSGITVNRFAATDDTAHFSAEPSGVIVRGLNLVRTEFNGRDSFSANSSRGLSWSDVSPDLLSRVDTYKNQMAQLIEGGIAGSVDMRTRLPFDQDGQMFAARIGVNFGDLAKETTPEGSILYSNRWNTGAGEFGFLANLAYSDVTTRTEGTELYRMNRYAGSTFNSTLEEVFIPAFVHMRETTYFRERTGGALAMQWQNPDESLVFSAQYNRSEYTNDWEEYNLKTELSDRSYGRDLDYIVSATDDQRPYPVPGTGDFVFDQNGVFRSGVAEMGYGWTGHPDPANAAWGGYFGLNSNDIPMVTPCYPWGQDPLCEDIQRKSLNILPTSRASNSENMTQDLSFNLKWAITDNVRAMFDVQYVDSTVKNDDIEWSFYTYATVDFDLSGSPTLGFQPGGTNINLSPAGWRNSNALGTYYAPGGFLDPNNYATKFIMDHIEDSEGDQLAVRADFEIDIGAGFLDSIKTGIRFAEREQLVQWAAYNWNAVAAPWVENKYKFFNLDQHDPANGLGGEPDFTGYPLGYYAPHTMDSSYHNISQREWIFPVMDLAKNREWMVDNMSAQALGMYMSGWNHLCSNENRGDKPRGNEIEGTCYTPGEVVDVSEETAAFYLQLDIGGGDATLFGIPYSGNIGARFVRTENFSSGAVVFPGMNGDEAVCTPPDPLDPPPPGTVPGTLGCYLSDADKAFMNGFNFLNDSSETHNNVLPSINLKLEFTEEWIGRLALSRAMSRPDIGNLRNYVEIDKTLPNTDSPSDEQWIPNPPTDITGVVPIYTADAHNPSLKPIIADQIDIAVEYYFADVGSLTLTLFAKEFDDYIQTTSQFISYENPDTGVERVVEVTRPVNGEGAELRGGELAFQRFFDFLPSPWDGLGMQASYTYIENDGITNTNTQSTEPTGGGTLTDQAGNRIEVDGLESLSEDSYTFIAMFEHTMFDVRLAYSWRSEYLSTAVDCCVAYAVYVEDTGHLDGSFTWKFSDSLTLKLKGANLTNEETVTRQQVNDYNDPDRTPALRLPTGNWWNDRRYTVELGLRF